MSSLALVNINKQFNDVPVLNNIMLTVQSGEFIALVGPSGCGKSTLLRIIAGLETPTSGKILLDNNGISEVAPGERNFSLIFQNYALFPHMTVEKNILFGLKIRKEPKAHYQERLAKVSNMLHLSSLLKRMPKELSGGQRQRVAMARAIIRNPALFLMDEPLSNLDAKLRVEVRQGIIDLHKQLQKTVIYVTHDQTEAMTMADRIVVLNKGQIQQEGTPETLYRHPNNLFVATFIGSPSMNILRLPVVNNTITLHGKSISLPQPHYAEEEVYVGIRPEHLTITHARETLPSRIFLEGTISHRELHGSDYQMTLSTPYGNIQYRHPNQGEIPKVSDSVNVCVDSHQLHFFSTQHETNLKGVLSA